MFETRVTEEGVAKFSGSLTIRSVDALHEELAKIFNEDSCIKLDCTDVAEIDSAAIQILLAFKVSLFEISRSIEYVVSPAMSEALELSGLSRFFDFRAPVS